MHNIINRNLSTVVVYDIGDRVRIVPERTGHGWLESMNKYLGSTMTIRWVYDYGTFHVYLMEEDLVDDGRGLGHKFGHVWYADMIQCLADDVDMGASFDEILLT